MFLLSILVIYLAPVIYTYFRVKSLFLHKSHKWVFTVFYIILAQGFFMAEILSHNNAAGWIKYVILAGFYALPFMLYLFLLTLLFDILRGINYLLKIVPAAVIKGRKFRVASLWILFVIPAAIVAVGAVHVNTIRVNEYHVDIPRKSAAVEHFKIAVAADFHLGQMTDKRFLEKFKVKINSLRPDILLMPGDIVEGHRDDGNTTEFARSFRQIETKYGIYAAPGNHESHGRNNKSDFFTKAGIEMLADRFVVIADSFCLLGRNDRHSENRKSIAAWLQIIPRNLPVIVIDHRPTDIEAVSKSGVDIQLSGHTHNGQLFPLNFIIAKLYKLGWGYKKISSTHFFVTSGIQVWGPPVRTAGDSEIMLINVDFKD